MPARKKQAEQTTDSEFRCRLVAAAADSLRASDIVALDLRPLTIIADFFVICTGKSSVQIRSIADRMEERMRAQGYRKHRIEGYRDGTWILLDYGDVVAHVMAAEAREFYNLETFWAAAERLELVLDVESTATPPELPAVRTTSARTRTTKSPALQIQT
ncbi:MAG: ribosome silencing factor [Armatimonadetes bacterium]|nr:ribosome silencing factor [Armatimonadota bacterium]MDE2205197.1 ribosome silencing factor [Armatimonadota bacterium]